MLLGKDVVDFMRQHGAMSAEAGSIRKGPVLQNVRFCYRGSSAHRTIISRPRPIFTSRVQAFFFSGRSLHRSARKPARAQMSHAGPFARCRLGNWIVFP